MTHDRGSDRQARTPTWETRLLPADYDLLAPDGSRIRVLPRINGASMVHCSLPAGDVTRAERHRTVEELWYVLSGAGQLWRRIGAVEETVDLMSGVAVSLPLGVEFQFRAAAGVALELVIVTVPPWPGEDEAVAVRGAWEPT